MKNGKKFDQWYDDVELANQSAGGHLPEGEKNLLQEAWDIAMAQPKALRLGIAFLAGLAIGALIMGRSSRRHEEDEE